MLSAESGKVALLKEASSLEILHIASRTICLSLFVTKDSSDSACSLTWTKDGPRGKYVSGLWHNLKAETAEVHLPLVLGVKEE